MSPDEGTRAKSEEKCVANDRSVGHTLPPLAFMPTRISFSPAPSDTITTTRFYSSRRELGRLARRRGERGGREERRKRERERKKRRGGQLNAPRQPMHANAYLTGLRALSFTTSEPVDPLVLGWSNTRERRAFWWLASGSRVGPCEFGGKYVYRRLPRWCEDITGINSTCACLKNYEKYIYEITSRESEITSRSWARERQKREREGRKISESKFYFLLSI